jgi:endo-1,4-beta-xylanase
MPVRDRPDPSWEDPNVGFARAHDLPLTGLHLLWYQGTPHWVDSLDRAAMEKAVVDHIAAMGARYRGHIFSWNVVNEAIDPDNGDPDGLRRFPLLDRLGPELFTIAFGAARAADPKAIRVYNDYGMELATPGEERRRSALLRLLDRLQRAGVPLDAVGLQSHLRWQGFSFDPARCRAFLREIAARGLSIIISELDVLDVGTPAEPAQRDKAVAEIYARFLAAALDEPAVIALVGWGLSDRYTWLTPQSAPIFARGDGLPGRPLPFDDHFQPKPAYWAMLNALKHAPLRKV